MRRSYWVVGLFSCVIALTALGLLARAVVPQGRAGQPDEQGTTPPELQVIQRITFSSLAPAFFDPRVRCDLNGNLYAVYGESIQTLLATLPYSDGVARVPFYKLSPGSKTRVPFPIPSISSYPYLLRRDLDVDARGTAFALFDAFDNANRSERKLLGHLIVRYNDDGSMDSYTKLADLSKKETAPAHFAHFADGSFLVTGTLWDRQEVSAFTAVFNRAGTFVTSIKLPHEIESAPLPPSQPPPKKGRGSGTNPKSEKANGSVKAPPAVGTTAGSISSAVSGSLMVSAPDGNVYLLRPANPLRLYAISSAGEVVHSFEIRRPSSGLTPLQMALAGTDKVFIQFRRVGAGSQGQSGPVIVVVELSSGHVSAVYNVGSLENDLTEPGCASSPYDFIFVGGTRENKLEIVRLTAR